MIFATRLLNRAINVHPQEIPALLWSFAYFFCLLCSYYILRPVRDEMGIAGGVGNLQWLFTGTFIAMLCVVPLFGLITSRYPRRRFLPLVYGFFIVNILLFYGLFQTGVPARYIAWAFFIWISVFNLFVVSVFWSFMADIYSDEQARRLFGFIAAGGSAGAVVGPLLTASLAQVLGPTHLLLISATILALALLCIHRLLSWADRSSLRTAETTPGNDEQAMGGSVLAGVRLVLHSPYLLGICLFILLYTTLATFLYFQQAHIIEANFTDPGQRTAVFASIDLAVNTLTILTQVFLTGRIVAYLGLPSTLALIPGLMMLGFLGLGLAPILGVLIVFQVIRRAGNYAITRPGREMLFTVVGREEKYKAKNFIDTVVYRGGDAVSGWTFAGLSALGLGLSAIAFIAVPVAAVFMATGVYLGKHQQQIAKHLHGERHERAKSLQNP